MQNKNKQSTTMPSCVHEAHRGVERKFLARAVCMSVVQDVSTRGPLLLTRYIARGLGLERARGMLQVVDGGQRSGAQAIFESVLRGIRAMATKRRKHAGAHRTKRAPNRRVAFVRHFASIVKLRVADGAKV